MEQNNTCRHCKKTYDKGEIARIYGSSSNVYALNYCSSYCYNQSVAKPRLANAIMIFMIITTLMIISCGPKPKHDPNAFVRNDTVFVGGHVYKATRSFGHSVVLVPIEQSK